ncbi:hypothetical protein REPUB_Repub02eG0118600 [Reevesia pubescens]
MGKVGARWFVEKYGSLPYFLPIQIDKPLMEATLPFWDPSYRCFTFNQEDMTPTLEEYSILLQIKSEASHRIYWKEQGKSRYRKRVYQILGFEDPKKIDDQGIPWTTLKKYIMETNNQEQASELFALAIYGLMVFPKILGHIKGSVVDFYGQVNKGINLASSILAETIRTLNFCRRNEKGRLIGCT